MVKLNLKDILDLLQKKQFDFQEQSETNQIYMVHKVNDWEFPIFVRVYDSPLLQLLAFIPTNWKETAINDTARLLHLLNKEIDIPGFGLDEHMGLIYYRCMLPATNNEIDEKIIETFIISIQRICENLAPVIIAVSSGALTFEEALDKARQHSQEEMNPQK